MGTKVMRIGWFRVGGRRIFLRATCLEEMHRRQAGDTGSLRTPHFSSNRAERCGIEKSYRYNQIKNDILSRYS